MNTILTDRLFSDPRLTRLARELGCPVRAIGALAWLWHGSQNQGLSILSSTPLASALPVPCTPLASALLDVWPIGTKSPRALAPALVASGFLEVVDGGYRVVGNDEHIQARDKLKEKARFAARKRWESKNAPGMQDAFGENAPSKNDDAQKCPPLSSFPPSFSTGGETGGRAREEQVPYQDAEPGTRRLVDRTTLNLFEGSYREAFKRHNRGEPLRWELDQHKAASTGLRRAGGMATKYLDTFIACDARDYWREHGWSIEVWAEDLDVIAKLHEDPTLAQRWAKKRDKAIGDERPPGWRADVPSDDEMAKREQIKRDDLEKNGAEYERAHAEWMPKLLKKHGVEP